jgi:hypothetical protein
MSKLKKYNKTKKDIPLVTEEEAVYLARVDGTLQDVKLRPIWRPFMDIAEDRVHPYSFRR